MSLTASGHSLHSHWSKEASDREIPFEHQASYITLSRTLTRLSNKILPLSASTHIARAALTPDQQASLRDLVSPLPYHRTKTLHTIEHARTLLLQLQQSAQHIRTQRVKRDVLRDLAEKRKVVRTLRGVIEELGREAERREREGVYAGVWDGYAEEGDEGETVEELLGLPPLEAQGNKTDQHRDKQTVINGRGREGEEKPASSPATDRTAEPEPSKPSPTSSSVEPKPGREELFNLRQRHQHRRPENPRAETTSQPATEKALREDRSSQDTLTSSLLSLATQLKSQSQSLSATLTTTDKAQVERALAALDSNVSGLGAASAKMGLLKRMSEGEGWWGRIMLYLWIWALWAVAVGLVFLGPKFRF